MNLIKRFKRRKQESQKSKFYNYIKSAKDKLKNMKGSGEAIYHSAKIHGALDFAKSMGLIDLCTQADIGNEVDDILTRVLNIIQNEQNLKPNSME